MTIRNATFKMTGKILTITVDTSKDGPPSASEKTLVISSTGGFVDVPDSNVKVSLNITTPNPKRPK